MNDFIQMSVYPKTFPKEILVMGRRYKRSDVITGATLLLQAINMSTDLPFPIDDILLAKKTLEFLIAALNQNFQEMSRLVKIEGLHILVNVVKEIEKRKASTYKQMENIELMAKAAHFVADYLGERLKRDSEK